jgi:hypothetical protein
VSLVQKANTSTQLSISTEDLDDQKHVSQSHSLGSWRMVLAYVSLGENIKETRKALENLC